MENYGSVEDFKEDLLFSSPRMILSRLYLDQTSIALSRIPQVDSAILKSIIHLVIKGTVVCWSFRLTIKQC
jgi:hypothetical protein